MSCYIRKFPLRYVIKDGREGWLQPHVIKLFGEGRWGVAQDKGGLLVGGQGAPIWLAGVIEKGCDSTCEEFDQIQCDMRGCRALQNEVDFRASHSRRAVEAYTRVISISLVVSYSEHVGRN